MIYFNYVCLGCTCGKTETKDKTFIVEKERSEEDDPEYCPNKPKKELKLVGERCTIGIAKFSGKLISKEEKVKKLKKRASDDYKKNIHERKVEMTRNAIKNFKNA